MRLKHGHSKRLNTTGTYRSWNAMLQRCVNKNHVKYSQYGARGIKVCERWSDFVNFLADMGERPKGKTIDRIDNSKGYEPNNCRWSTPKQQQNNRKCTKNITLFGETRTLTEWSLHLGIPSSTIIYRVKRGWSDEQIISLPPRSGRRIIKKNYNKITAFGETLMVSDWTKRFGIKSTTINERIRRGVNPEIAVSAPACIAGKRL